MSRQKTSGWWLTRDGWKAMCCTHAESIQALQDCALNDQDRRFMPAPLDLHVHGGGGADVMQGDDALVQVLRTHASHGTGAMLATSVTAPYEKISAFLQSVRRVMDDSPADAAHLLGAHLEGPFINPDKLGAQPAFATPLDLQALHSWLDSGVVRIMTYAPEMDPHNQIPALCRRFAVKAQIGHSLCDWHRARCDIEQGVGVTHLFNAMSTVSHRSGGVATAALAFSDYAEIITDGIHVDKAAFVLARRCIEHLYSVTDATAAAGMPDGDYQLGSLTVTKAGDRVTLPDGTLAGSALTQIRSLAVMRSWGLSWEAIADISSRFPALWMQLGDYGEISVGAVANWLELQHDEPIAIWLGGQRFDLVDKDSE